MNTQYHAMLITEENLHKALDLLGQDEFPQRWIERPNYLLWVYGHSTTAWVLPHAVFYDRYTVVDQRDENYIVERL